MNNLYLLITIYYQFWKNEGVTESHATRYDNIKHNICHLSTIHLLWLYNFIWGSQYCSGSQKCLRLLFWCWEESRFWLALFCWWDELIKTSHSNLIVTKSIEDAPTTSKWFVAAFRELFLKIATASQQLVSNLKSFRFLKLSIGLWRHKQRHRDTFHGFWDLP